MDVRTRAPIILFTVVVFAAMFVLVQAQSWEEFLHNGRFSRGRYESSSSSSTSFSASQSYSADAEVPFAMSTSGQEQDRISAIAGAQPAVVSVIISRDLPVLEQSYERVQVGNGMTIRVPRVRQNGTQLQQVGAGTAFFVSADGLLMTNSHVVSDKQAQYTVLTNAGDQIPATVVFVDQENDVALLQVQQTNTPFLEFSSDTAILGQTAIAIGNSLGEFRNTVSVGVVSGLQRSITAAVGGQNRTETLDAIIQTDAAINQGNSGGPLLNSQGKVIGMNVATATEAENIGFAIPSENLKKVMQQYR